MSCIINIDTSHVIALVFKIYPTQPKYHYNLIIIINLKNKQTLLSTFGSSESFFFISDLYSIQHHQEKFILM